MKPDQPSDGALASNEDASEQGSASESRQTTGLKLVTLSPGSVTNTDPRSASAQAPVAAQSAVAVPLPQAAPSEAPPPREASPPSTPPDNAGGPPGTQPDPYLGCTIDNRYKVEAVLGEGGMGVVYRCRHKIIDKKVAMKILRSDLARDREVTERFLIEAKAASAIGNEHIIDISDFGQLPDGSAYFVMEYLEGLPLSSRVEGEKPIPTEDILHVAIQLCVGLGAAHEEGIVHRDLKPDNIFLVKRGDQENFVKILDFGIAKVSSSPGKLTQAGSVFGTPHYMSPEQAAGAPVDVRGDIYAFGIIMYELASGRVPFDADNFMAILTQHMYKAPTPLRELELPEGQEISPGFDAVVLKCISKRAEERYQSMAELRADLERLMAGEAPTAVREMMARSSSFNVPADYFQQAQAKSTGGKTSAQGPRPWVWFMLATAATLGGLFWAFGRPQPTEVTPEPEPAETEQATAAGTDPQPVNEPAGDNEDLEIVRQVVLGIDPMRAHVFRDDKDLGTSPVVLEVKDGDQVEVEIKHAGYHSKTLTLDGSEQRISVKLDAIKAPHRAIARPTPTSSKKKSSTSSGSSSKKPKIGGNELVDPWATK